MGRDERRQAILYRLCKRRFDTMSNLANEYGVTLRTISSDVSYLSSYYPIRTSTGRYGGGVYMLEDFQPYSPWLTQEQKAVLHDLADRTTGYECNVLLQILYGAIQPSVG